MGEEKKEEGEKKEETEIEMVLKVEMHCEACARKVARALKGFQGVESVTVDYKGSKVVDLVVKGKDADPLKVSQRIQNKTGRKVDLISPLPTKPPPPPPPPEEQNNPPPEDKKEEVITVALKVQMHCDACAQVLQKRIRKLKGVESVTTNLGNNEVIVKGMVDPEKLVADVYKRTGKQASLVVVKEEEKKEDEKKEAEKQEKEEKTEVVVEVKKSDQQQHPQRYSMNMMEYPQMFSDENPNACCVM